MALRNILTEEDESLRKISRPVTQFNDRLFQLLDDMKETLAASNGVGLAAPQVGVLRRVVLVLDDDEQPLELINPVILESDGEQDGPEGCLSLPGIWGLVKRPDRVVVKYQDRNGDEYTIEGFDLMAREFCHELDHLDGVLFADHVYKYITEEEVAAWYEDAEQEVEPFEDEE